MKKEKKKKKKKKKPQNITFSISRDVGTTSSIVDS